jgi:hypothetical protein
MKLKTIAIHPVKPKIVCVGVFSAFFLHVKKIIIKIVITCEPTTLPILLFWLPVTKKEESGEKG